MTFRDPEAARRACVDATPIIDGRRANCNLASLGRPRLPMHYAMIPNLPGQSGFIIYLFFLSYSDFHITLLNSVRTDKTCIPICWKCAGSSRFTLWKPSVSATICL